MQDETEFKPGDMDVRYHQRTFDGFVKISTWVVGLSFAVLIFLALANA